MQNNFFEEEQNSEQHPPVLPAGDEAPQKRVFAYDGQHFEDPGPQYSIRDVMAFLAESYPELQTGTWSQRSLPDGAVEYTFSKVTGDLGSRVRAGSLAAGLAEVEPLELQAPALTGRIVAAENNGELTAAELLRLAPEVEEALAQAGAVSERSRRCLERCLVLKPVSQPTIPLGF